MGAGDIGTCTSQEEGPLPCRSPAPLLLCLPRASAESQQLHPQSAACHSPWGVVSKATYQGELPGSLLPVLDQGSAPSKGCVCDLGCE